MTIWTIGHSNTTMEHFLDLLHRSEIQVVADVRSQPYSKYTRHFDLTSLRGTLPETGIKYVFLGRELGGRPEDRRLYDGDGHVRYDKLSETDLFQQGIQRLIDGLAKFRIAILCSEEDPVHCHRRLLISRVLGTRGVVVHHLRGDGRVQPESEIAAAETGDPDGPRQLTLLPVESPPWRSIRSVLPSAPPPTSLEH